MRQTVALLGTPVDILNMDQTLARLEQFIQERRFHQVATANTDFLVNAMHDPELQYILRAADLVVPDGMPLVWASRGMGSPLPERVTGADLVPRLACLAAQKGYRIYMLGARPEVARMAKAKLQADYPGIQIVGCVSPPAASIIEMDGDALLADIERAAPDILLVAFGNPKQEKWIHMHRGRLQNVPVCIGIGGTFDFIAGEVPRAPSALQRAGFEWVHRLVHNPRYLWKRYGRDLVQGGPLLWRQWRALRKQRRTGDFGMCMAEANDCVIFSLRGDFHAAALAQFRSCADAALEEGSYLILDMQGVTSVDAEALGGLIDLQKRAAECRRTVRLVNVPPQITRTLHDSQVQAEFLPVASCIAHALTERQCGGLSWRVQGGSEAAVITVHGASDREEAEQLEMICACLLRGGRKVDLDVRGISYIDSTLLAVFYRLQSRNIGCFRLVAGNTLLQSLEKEKLRDHFTLCEAPQFPQDAKEITPCIVEARLPYRAGENSDPALQETVRSLVISAF